MKKLSFSFIIVFSILLSGCTGGKQLHERLIVQGLGVDKENNLYNVTVQFLTADNSGEEMGENYETISLKGDSIIDAISKVSNITGKEPMYSQNLILILGEEVARDGISKVIDFFIRHYECRPTVTVFIAKENASKILTLEGANGIITADKISEMSNAQRLNSNIIFSNVLDVVNCLYNNISDPKIACINIDNGDLVIADSTAVFNEDKLSGFLAEDLSRGVLLVSDSVLGGTEVIDIKGLGKVTFNLTDSKSKVNFQNNYGTPCFNINVNVKSNIYEINKDVNSLFSDNYIATMEAELKNRLESLIYNAIRESIFNYKSDVFNFGKIIKRDDKEFFKNIKSLKEVLMKSDYNINVDVKVKKMGQERIKLVQNIN